MYTKATLSGLPLGGTPLQSVTYVNELVSFLQAVPLFAGLAQTELRELACTSQTRLYEKGAQLFRQGDPIQKVSVIHYGTVKLMCTNSNGSQITLALRGKGETLDLPVGAAAQTHHSTGAAITTARLLFWKMEHFDLLVRRSISISANLVQIFSSQLSELEKRYHEVVSEKVERRVALTLIRVAPQIGSRFQGGFVVPITRQDLAELSGTNLFSVSRLISRWDEVGLLSASRGGVVIPDLVRLDDATAELR